MNEALPGRIRDRKPQPHITRDELIKLMEWKLKKGKWRPQLMGYVKALNAKAVKDASIASFQELRDGKVKEAFEKMCELKGVGPATASAVLAAVDPNIPFMADEALEAVASEIGPRKYTMTHYMKYLSLMQEKAEWLSGKARESSASEDGEGNAKAPKTWSAQKVQLALYAATNLESDVSKSGTGKRSPARQQRNTRAAKRSRK